MSRATVADLMEPRPTSWGLRGDPLLWKALIKVFQDHPMPENEATLISEFDVAFQALTDHRLAQVPETLTILFLKGDKGGISNGVISGLFWRETALPLILSRYRAEIG